MVQGVELYRVRTVRWHRVALQIDKAEPRMKNSPEGCSLTVHGLILRRAREYGVPAPGHSLARRGAGS
jgi:hypothetical protein